MSEGSSLAPCCVELADGIVLPTRSESWAMILSGSRQPPTLTRQTSVAIPVAKLELMQQKLIFPGVGNFGQATESLRKSGLMEHLQRYIESGRPFFGICIGMQMLFESSAESPESKGLGLIPCQISRFSSTDTPSRPESNGHSTNGESSRAYRPKSVPHMGWNSAWRATENDDDAGGLMLPDEDYYFVHSYCAIVPLSATDSPLTPYLHTLTRYGSEIFASSVRFRNVFATQFHPEKSGAAGLELLRRWLDAPPSALSATPSVSSPRLVLEPPPSSSSQRRSGTGLTSRVVACLDVRSNDQGDLVVTKGDQYDVRDKSSSRTVRNLGKPVALAQRYYQSGADEICFLNITSFRSSALLDQPMLEVVRGAAETVFVPLTVGGGIKDTVDPDGTPRSALEVAGAYFRSGADKVSIGSDAVVAVEDMLEREKRGELALTGQTAIETISKGYGSQAVVVSIDPRRVYLDLADPEWKTQVGLHLPCVVLGSSATTRTAPQEKDKAWWYQCTVSGGRAVRDLDVIQLAQGAERLGTGEILLNSVDRDGSGLGFDLDLINLVRRAVNIPVVASSGAGCAEDFVEVFAQTETEAALAAGIFHRGEVGIDEVKGALQKHGMGVRRSTVSG